VVVNVVGDAVWAILLPELKKYLSVSALPGAAGQGQFRPWGFGISKSLNIRFARFSSISLCLGIVVTFLKLRLT
jgi:hypothetical protein